MDPDRQHPSPFVWDRASIVSCQCTEKKWRHIHCPCRVCKNKAVSRTTEIKHWKDACLEKRLSQSQYGLEKSDDDDASDDENTELPYPTNDDIDFQEDVGVESASPVPLSETNSTSVNFQQLQQIDTSFSNDEDTNSEMHVPLQYSESGESLASEINEEKDKSLKKLIVETVLDATKIIEKHGCSATVFEDILALARKIMTNKVTSTVEEDILNLIWPANWEQAQKLLRECGHSEAKQYFVCYCYYEKNIKRDGKIYKKKVYNGNWDLLDDKNKFCKNCGRKSEITFYYLGLNTKVVNWFKREDMCRKMLSHWYERDHWLGATESFPVKRELWDGQRWCNLHWYWDPKSQWMLPTICPCCKEVIPVERIRNAESLDNGERRKIECDNCLAEFEHTPKLVNGSPLNLALVAHWDGWQSVGSSYRSSGSIEVSVANMLKKDRNQVEEVYVVEFIPAYQLPRGCPQMLDAFMKPLMDELVDSFITGFEIPYPLKRVPEYCVKDYETVRLLLLLWTGDHPGQCEIGKFLNQGKCACRRCKLIGQHLEDPRNNHFYYGENRKHGRYPWEPRSLDAEIVNMLDIEMEKRPTVRKKMSSEKGFTGLSLLHQYLFPLYGFDVLRDTVFDIFHTLPLNVVKNELTYMLDQEIIQPADLDNALQTFPWTRELKDGRLPTPIGNDLKGISNWKAESYQKFAFPFAECALEDKIEDDEDFEILSMVSRLVEMHFWCGRDGWNDSMISSHRSIAQRLNIKVEEVQGLAMCTISFHNLIHVAEDIINFSATENYWCAVFERAVKNYIKKSHNSKGIEITFAKSESRREFLKSVDNQRTSLETLRYDLERRIASSENTARILSSSARVDGKCFLLGSLKSEEEMAYEDKEEVSRIAKVPVDEVPETCATSRRYFSEEVGYSGTVFTSNEFVLVTSEAGEKFVFNIGSFLSVLIQGRSHMFVKGEEFQFIRDQKGDREQNFWTGFGHVPNKSNGMTVLISARNILRKVILLKGRNPDTLIVTDFQRKERQMHYSVNVPPWIESNDMVLIQGQAIGDVWHGKVLNVDRKNEKISVIFFTDSKSDPDLLVRESLGRTSKNSVSMKSVIGIESGHWITKTTWKKSE